MNHERKPRTFFDKVWDDHLITALGPDTDLLQIDRLVLHELSGSQAMRSLRIARVRCSAPVRAC